MPPAGDGSSRASSGAGTVSAKPGGGTSCAGGRDTAGVWVAGVGAAGAVLYDGPASRATLFSTAADGGGGDGRHANGVTGSRLSSPPDAPRAPAVRNAGTAGVGTSMTGGDSFAGNGATKEAGDVKGAGNGAAIGTEGCSTGSVCLGEVDCALRSAAPSPEAVAGPTAGAAGAVRAAGSEGATAAGALVGGWMAGGGAPHARPASVARATGAGGGRTSVSDTSGNRDGGADGSKCADASNTSLHWPQRTHPSDMRNWSATTLKEVAQDGQRVIWLISGGL